MNQSNHLKTYREDAQWFYDRHPVACAFSASLFAFTFFALCECLWPSHPGRSYSEHVWRLVFKAIFFALLFSSVRRWRKARRVSSTSSTRPAGPVYDLS